MIDPALGTFVFTAVVETALALPRGRFVPWTRGLPFSRTFVDVPLANLLTQPLAQWLYSEGGVDLLSVELGVFVVEALVYRFVTRLPWGRAALLSIVLNAATLASAFVW